MANRIVGNVVIIDSGTINLQYFNAKVAAAAFYGANSASQLVITMASSTLDSVIAFTSAVNNSGAFSQNIQLGGVVFSDTLRVLTLTAGTGWLYLV